MPRSTHARSVNQESQTFAGFALPTSNTTYTPNQFFDVCLPHYSRGVVRLVGYMIRKTLGWCDSEGKPQHERIRVSFSELSDRAGISREMIRSALAEATAGGFVRRVREGRPNRVGEAAVSAEYELAWDESVEYVKNPKRFQGFFAGEGNRTYIPNQFFDFVLPHETLAVVKVVGSVIRFSIGFQTKWGHRRQQTALSYQTIQNYSKIRNRSTLSEAISTAMDHHYIQRMEEGYFDPNGGLTSKAAVYALQWLHSNADELNGQKNVPAKTDEFDRSEKQTGNGQISVPAERSEKRTDIQIKESNNTLKQHKTIAAETFERLKAEGFDARSAEAIAHRFTAERIERQLRWIDRRQVKANRLGMIRTAIEQDWAEPVTPSSGNLRQRNSAEPGSGISFAEAVSNARRRLTGN